MIYTKANAGPIAGKIPPQMRGHYIQRVVKASAKISGAGNPQFVWETEIVQPQQAEFDGQTYDLTGCKNTYYLPCTVDKDPKKNGIAKTIDLLGRCQLKEEIDLDKFQTPEGQKELVEGHEGIFIETLIDSFEDKATRPDPENKGKYITIKDGEGKEISRGYKMTNNINDILGQAVDFKMDQPY